MLKRKRILAFVCASAAAASMAACTPQGESVNSQSVTTTAADDVKTSSGMVELKTYEFPEFLNEIGSSDVLLNPIYSDFDSADYVEEVAVQPFDDYECESLVADVLYIFTEDRFKGIIDKKGEVIIEADTYTEITLGARGLLVLSRDKELNIADDYARFDDSGRVTMDFDFEYQSDSVMICERTVEISDASAESESSTKTVYDVTLPDGTVIGDDVNLGSWDSVLPIDSSDIDTTKVFSGYYKAVKDGLYYYICIDRYYNYTIFSGEYGFIRLKVGSVYGECYILDSGDYSELIKMLDSFGSSSSQKTPSKDETLDFIQIDTGLNTDEQQTITVSSDGFCLVDYTQTGSEQPLNKYFKKLDKESFVSLVQWVEQALSKEYQ